MAYLRDRRRFESYGLSTETTDDPGLPCSGMIECILSLCRHIGERSMWSCLRVAGGQRDSAATICRFSR